MNVHNDESLFFCNLKECDKTLDFISKLKNFSIINSKQVYILNTILGTNKEYKYDIDIKNIAIILIPKHPILILNYGTQIKEYTLKSFTEDFQEDLGNLSSKYDYDKILGRTRKWPTELFRYGNLESIDINEYLNYEIQDTNTQRMIELLISLAIGSINNIDKISVIEPKTLLDKVKQKIILFDGKQSSFIYQDPPTKIITIQGMAGTGKTELLLHKLKEIYSLEKSSKIAFTCYNKVLANVMKTRIPLFFNYLKVDEQIEWDERLNVFSSWGSANESKSGLYSFICTKYGIPFYNYGQCHDFKKLCEMALNELTKKEHFEPCFDYIFIDESQDFDNSFFELCEKITKNKVYIAGDIFQNIFDTNINKDIEPMFLLNKCYRTDPKTLMFAHAVGMGLYEKPQINWLSDDEWLACGYCYDRDDVNNTFSLSRKPLRRFEDLESTNTIKLYNYDTNEGLATVMRCIDEIRNEHPTVSPEDIAIVILNAGKNLFDIADRISFSLSKKYNWFSSKGYITKKRVPKKVYISNANNIKGLEFPFLICIFPGIITDNILQRNSIYMALTRSFLTSYFVVNNENKDFISTYSKSINEIYANDKMILSEPTKEQLNDIKNRITISLSNIKISPEKILRDFLDDEYNHLQDELKSNVVETILNIVNTDTPQTEELKLRAKNYIELVLKV